MWSKRLVGELRKTVLEGVELVAECLERQRRGDVARTTNERKDVDIFRLIPYLLLLVGPLSNSRITHLVNFSTTFVIYSCPRELCVHHASPPLLNSSDAIFKNPQFDSSIRLQRIG
ncbi:hypothetical protein GCK72_016341 [Caenorhabditis remanei]|uniref:Uncharacterized protein n=1 Tax=Caenorhabditis remanei TaxID=31234 RepID=A0A6A5GZB6_CAERE|nr:hypothetical protein GCK72_016341 [Caenorhabditis remanei]KAF1759874.1 hypothetical protein GCK72_016341 [Caenorhabditis remanei]